MKRDLFDSDVSLRSLRDDDKDTLAQLANNKKIADNLRDVFPFPYTVDDAIFFINLTKQENPQLTFAIEYQGKLCGVAGLLKHADIYKNTAEIGYWIGEPYWNKGIATRAVKLLTEYGLRHLNYARLQTGIFEHNKSSMKVLEKCGYRLEGVFQKSLTKHGKLWDEYRYGIINPNN